MFYSNVIFILSRCSFKLNLVKISMCYLPKVFSLFPCNSKSFLNFKLSSTWVLINWFLIKKTGIRERERLSTI